MREGFRGELVVSPVTGELYLHYPRRRRLLRYALSAAVTLPALAAAALVIFALLNLEAPPRPIVRRNRAGAGAPSICRAGVGSLRARGGATTRERSRAHAPSARPFHAHTPLPDGETTRTRPFQTVKPRAHAPSRR